MDGKKQGLIHVQAIYTEQANKMGGSNSGFLLILLMDIHGIFKFTVEKRENL